MLITPKTSLSCAVETCGMQDGEEVYLITLTNGNITVVITNIGCSILSIQAPDRDGIHKNIVAGFTEPRQYLDNPWYFGSVIGRYANRIGGASFPLDGDTIRLSANENGNHLHGGLEGFNKKIWRITNCYHHDAGAGVLFGYRSPRGEEGYPGNLDVRVHYTLNPAGQLQVRYYAVTDEPTPVNLSNHSYFNLSGFAVPHIADHVVMIQANVFAAKQDRNLPTGKLWPVEGTPLDLRSPRRLGDVIDGLTGDRGFDHHYVLDGVQPAVEVYDPGSGRLLRVSTDRPGVQLYTANWWDGSIQGAHAAAYRRHGALALETQALPDSPNRPEFPGTILRPGETYATKTIFTFAIK